MQPGAIGAKQDFVQTGPLHRLFEQVKAAHPSGVGVDIGVTHEMVDQAQLGSPVIRKAAKMWDDEVDVRILRGQ